MTIPNRPAGKQTTNSKRKLAILGSTGSIGMQTLEIVRHYPEEFAVTVLSSNERWEELARQAAEFLPAYVVIADKSHEGKLRDALRGMPVKVLAGAEELARVTGESDADTVVNALVGFAGLSPTVEAVKAGKKLALANKESLVVAGEYVMRLAQEKSVDILPIDSEHSAILQCISGESSSIKKVILTASGGALRDIPVNKLPEVTVMQALAHPNWDMGAKITIDSATMVNKGFEVIEARWLFGLDAGQIQVLIHPQSVVHSMVEFADGAIKAQLGTADMRLPIQYALTYPERWKMPAAESFNFARELRLDFSEPDTVRFPALATSYEVLRTGGDRGCVLNGANEAAVAAFLAGKIRFTDITRTIDHCLDALPYGGLGCMEEITACHNAVMARAGKYISTLANLH